MRPPDFDRPHVFIVTYLYNLPTIKNASRFVGAVANGWGVTGVTTVQSGEPFSVIDFSGAAGSLYFSADDEVTNPILPLASGITPQQATQGGTDQIATIAGSSPVATYHVPYVNPDDFALASVTHRRSAAMRDRDRCAEPDLRSIRNWLRFDGPQRVSRPV